MEAGSAPVIAGRVAVRLPVTCLGPLTNVGA